MGIHVRCAQCQTSIDAPFSAAGGTTRCPRCGAEQAVPSVASLTASVSGPATSASEEVTPADEEAIRRLLIPPATALIVVGALALVGSCGGVFYRPQVGFQGEGAAVRGAEASAAVSCIGLLMAPLILFGAMQMYQLKGRFWAITAAVVALLPCNAACCLTMPCGLWALVVLMRPKVKAYFEQRESDAA